MDDWQFKTLIAVIGAFGTGLIGIIKYAVTRITTAMDANTASHLKSAEAMATMSTKLDFVYGASREVKDFIHEEISGVHNAPNVIVEDNTPVENPRRQTPPKGTTYFHGPKRHPTKG